MKKWIFYAVMLLVVTSCAKNEEISTVPAPVMYGYTEDDLASRTGIETDSEGIGTIWWNPGDEINIFFGKNSVKYHSINTEKSTVVAFDSDAMITIPDSHVWALYPYDADAACDGTSVSTTIPSAQKGIADTFDTNLFTMVAETDTNELYFKNVCGGVKLTLSRDDIKKITFRGNSNEYLAGKVRISMNEYDYPVSEVNEGINEITLTPKSGSVFAKNTNYYLVMLPEVLSNGFTMIFETALQLGTFEYTEKPVEIKRSIFSVKENIDTYATFVDKTYDPISSASEFKDWIENKASFMTKDDVVVLSADIDLQSESVNPVSSFAGTFDGQGFAIKNADLSKGVFANVTESGIVMNVIIDSSCTAKADANVFGTLVTVNSGLVSDCVNNANISTTAARAAGAIGGLVGQSNGSVTKCINNGSITVQTSTITGAMYYGGVVGQITLTKEETSDKVLVDGCGNYGNLVVRCTTTPKNAYVGGVVGGNTASKLADVKLVGVIQNCVNAGNVDYGFDVLSNGTYTNIGGIVGYWEGQLKDCENGGNIAYSLPVSDTSVCSTCPATAGVAGVVIGNAENLVNRGNVTINGVWAAGTAGNAGAGGYHMPIWGGVIAKHGTDYQNADNNVTADNLENYGTISGNIYMKDGGGTIHILGGVLGTSNGKLSHLYNYGTVNVLMGGKSNYVGGIIGHHSGMVLSDSVNSGAVTVDGSSQVLTSQIVGGIVAYELIKDTVLSNLENKGAITLKESNPATSNSYQYLAGIMGNYSGNTQTLNNCINRGVITSNTTKKVRVAGVIAAIYDSTTVAPTANAEKTIIETKGTPGTNPLVECHNYGNIFVNNAGNPASTTPGSIVGGIACYCSVGMKDCSNTGDITLKNCATNTAAGLMAGTINRRYKILDCKIAGKLSSNVADNKLGLFAGSLYTDPAIFDFGSASQPVTIAASATINGVAPKLNVDGLVGTGNNYNKAQQVVIVNVMRE